MPWRAWMAAGGAVAVSGVLVGVALVNASSALGWTMIAAAVALLLAPTVAARRLGQTRSELIAFTFAAVMLLWPLILIATVIIASGSSADSG